MKKIERNLKSFQSFEKICITYIIRKCNQKSKMFGHIRLKNLNVNSILIINVQYIFFAQVSSRKMFFTLPAFIHIKCKVK